MIEWLIKIFIWLVLAILLTIIPFHLERSKQRYKLTPFITYSIIGINVLIFLVMIVYTILQDPTFYARGDWITGDLSLMHLTIALYPFSVSTSSAASVLPWHTPCLRIH